MKTLGVFLSMLFLGFLLTFISVDAGALAVPSWLNGPPIVTSYQVPSASTAIPCAGYSTEKYVVELGVSRPACVNQEEQLKIGYIINGGVYQGVVGFAYSNNVHLLGNVCARMMCIYSANTDTLVTQQVATQNGLSLVVYAHASERIHKIHPVSGPVIYEFDTTNPSFEMKNDVGRYILTPAFGVSENGRWAVAELRDKGLVLLNNVTFETRQISTSGMKYGYGMDPTEELAVSNDGKTVVLTGQNSGFTVYAVTPECGQQLIGLLDRLYSTVDCPATSLDIGTTFPNLHSADHPHLYGDGYQLEARVHSWVEGDKRVTFLAHGSSMSHRLKLLALGDSFTSGEGEDDQQFYMTGTNVGVDTCHVSKRSYPLLIAARIGLSDTQSKSVACAGASIGDITGSNTSYKGQGDRLGPKGLKLSADGIAAAQETAIETFQPGRSRQSLFIERYNPEKLLIGIGGNDAGFMGKLRVCIMPGTCEWAFGEGLRATAAEIQRLTQTLGNVFAQISERYPDTSVYIAGYPEVIDPDGRCDTVTGALLDHTERAFMKQSVIYLNQIIKYAAKKADFTYLDVEKSMQGRTLCSDSSDPAMNGLKLGHDIAIINSLPKIKVLSAGTFHPRPTGHALEADAILAGHPGLQKDSLCSINSSGCDVDPEPPSYWGMQNAANDRRMYEDQFAASIGGDSDSLVLNVADGTFESGTSVRIEMHSELVALGTFSVSDNGGLHENLSVPADIDPGYHTLHLLGVNREGALIDVYQFITVGVDASVVESAVMPVSVTNANSDSNRTQSFGTKIPATAATYTGRSVETTQADSAEVLGVSSYIGGTSSDSNMVEHLIIDPIRIVDRIVKQQIAVVLVVIAVIVALLAVILWRVRRNRHPKGTT